MTTTSQARGTLTGRRARLSDEETERRMLNTAIAMANESGLTVSLEHLSFEDVIRDARVSRTAAYRRWPYKDLFFMDLLRELAKGATPAAVSSDESAISEIRRIVREHADWLETPQLRRELLLELIRLAGLHDFETMRGSTEWRTYLALQATHLGVADEAFRAELRGILAQSERDFIRRVAASWEQLTQLFGYRLRPELHVSFELVASAASADVRGQVMLALAAPEISARRTRATLPGSGHEAEWSLPALTLAAIVLTFLEPDPDIDWDDGRVTEIRRALEFPGVEPGSVA